MIVCLCLQVSYIPDGDVLSQSKKEMLAYVDTAMAGHVAEELVLGPDNVTTGSFSDFQQATKIATNMVTKWGMSNKVRPAVCSRTLMVSVGP